MSNGKGGSQTAETAVPEWAKQYAQQNILGPAAAAAQMGYMPYYGPDVAAMTPAQTAAMQSGIGAAEAYGLIEPGSLTPQMGMQAPGNYGGMPAYSSGGLYDMALAELGRRAPGQMAMYRSMFVDPMTGVMPMTGERFTGQNAPTTEYIQYLLSQGITGLPEGVSTRKDRDREERDYTLGGRIGD